MPKAPRQFTLTCWWSVLLSFICVFDRVLLAVLHFPPTEEWAHTKPSSPVCLAAGHGLVHKGFAFSSSESQLRCGQAKSRGLGGQSGWWLRKILSVVSDLQAGRTDWTGKMEGWNENLFGNIFFLWRKSLLPMRKSYYFFFKSGIINGIFNLSWLLCFLLLSSCRKISCLRLSLNNHIYICQVVTLKLSRLAGKKSYPYLIDTWRLLWKNGFTPLNSWQIPTR